MPLHVTISINDTPIEQLHIGRLDKLYSNVQVSRYVAMTGEYEPRPEDEWDVEFEHKYSDGALVCVEKALRALNKKRSEHD